MMKKKLLAAVSLLLTASLFLAACSKDGAVENSGKEKEEESKISWLDSHVSLSSHYDGVAVRDGVIYGYYEDENGTQVLSQDAQSGEILQSVEIETTANVQNIVADKEGNIYLLELSENGFDGTFWKIDTQGQVSFVEDIVLEDTSLKSGVIPKNIYVDENGYFYLWYQVTVETGDFNSYYLDFFEQAGLDVNDFDATAVDRVYVKDSQFNTIFYEDVIDACGSDMLSFFFNENGAPIILAKDSEGTYIRELDVEQKKAVSERRMNAVDLARMDGPQAFTEDGFIYCKGNELYRYYYDTQEQELLLNLSSYGVLAANVLYLAWKDGCIQVVDNYKASENSEFVSFTEGVDQKETVTLGVMMATSETEELVAGFNRFNEDTRIEIVAYSNGEKYGEDLEQLKMDIVSGEAPDIIDVSDINPSMFSEKGAFTDLYERMEADGSFNKDMLMDTVLDAYEQDGHLYSLGYAFQLYSIWGSESVVQGRSGVGTDELVQILKDHGKDANALFGVSADEPLLTTLCAFAMDSFIDWENAECSLSGDYMGTILDFAKGYSTGYEGAGVSAGIASGDILLTIGIIDSVADYQIESELYGGISFIGYPTEHGSGTAVSFRGEEFAINAASESQDAAWEFVKYCVENGYNGQGFPLLKTQFDEAMQEAMKPDMVTDMDETYEMPKQTFYDGDNGYLYAYAASQEDVDAVIRLVESADTRHQYNTKIQEIIDEEAEVYFKGQNNLQTTVDHIQDRVTIYLQEQM
ncbi:MAG: hypothetical protein ACI4F0_00855 [Agathobacter sp.]